MTISITPAPVTAQIVVGALVGISREDAQKVLGEAPAQSHTPGLAVATATSLSQVQAAIGMRQQFNPFAF